MPSLAHLVGRLLASGIVVLFTILSRRFMQWCMMVGVHSVGLLLWVDNWLHCMECGVG
jgi:hypothetical protein